MTRRWRALRALLLALGCAGAVWLVGCGGGATAPEPFTAAVGVDGGVYQLPGGAILTIPAGAVGTLTRITATVETAEATAAALQLRGSIWRLSPATLQLRRPATLQLPFAATGAGVARVATRARASDAWGELSGAVPRAGSVAVPIVRFGEYAPAVRGAGDPSGGRIVCWVTSGGAAVAGARVSVGSGPVTPGAVTTGANGAAELEGLTAGAYAIDVTADGYMPGSRAGIAVTAGQTAEAAVVLQTEGSVLGSIVGTVRDTTGAALAEAVVTVVDGPAVGRTAQTDAAGAYRLEDLPVGEYAVEATRSGYPDPQRLSGIQVTAGGTSQANFVLGAGGGITGAVEGHVRDQAGAAVAGAVVAVISGPALGASAITSAQGAYRLEGLVAGKYRLRATRSGYGIDERDVTVSAGGTAERDFVLPPPGEVTTGRIWGYTHTVGRDPIAGAAVTVTAGPTDASTTSDASGHYSLEQLLPGEYGTQASREGYTPTRAMDTVEVGRNTERDFMLVRPSGDWINRWIAGFVRDDRGNPVVGAAVEIVTGPSSGSDQTNADGYYGVDALLSGSYTVRASCDGYEEQTLAIQVVAGAYELNFTLAAQPGVIRGHVRTTGGAAIAGATVEVREGPSVVSTTTDAAGAYELANLAPGAYVLRASREGFAALEREAELPAGETVEVDFALTEGTGRILGHVRDAAGAGISSATVVIVEGPTGGSDTTDSGGGYELGDLSVGTYRVTARRTGYAEQTLETTVTAGEASELDFTLERLTGTIVGTVVDDLGLAVAGATVETTSGPTTASATTNGSGEYALSGLTPGSYGLRASRDGYDSDTASVSLSANEAETVDFELEAHPGSIEGKVVDPYGSVLQGVLVDITAGPTDRSDETSAAGLYELPNLHPGVYTLRLTKLGYETVEAQLEVHGGEEVTANYTMEDLENAFGRIVGVVRDGVGGAVSGATVWVTAGPVSRQTTTNVAGEYALLELPPGNYTIRAQKTGVGADVTALHVHPYTVETANFVLQ